MLRVHPRQGDAKMTIDTDKTLVSKIRDSCKELDGDNIFSNPKILLTAPFSEIRSESGTFLHTVQLYLTTDCEIVVLKKTADKSQRFSFLRRHNICQTDFSMHSILSNTLKVQVPNTVLMYSYKYNEPSETIVGEWLSKVAHLKMSKANAKERKHSDPAPPVKANTTSVGHPTTYQSTEPSLHTYSSPTHPVSHTITNELSGVTRPNGLSSDRLPQILASDETVKIAHRMLHDQSGPVCRPTTTPLIQMPSGLIKARSFQGRGSVKHRFVRSSSSTSGLGDIEQERTTPEELCCNGSAPFTSTPLPHSTLRTPSPVTDEKTGNPFESHLRHTQIRNRKWKFSPRINRSNSTQPAPTSPALTDVIDKYSRSANSTPTPGVTSSLATTSSTAEASELTSQSSNSSTLPRIKKGKKSREERYTSVSESTNGPTPSKTPSKSPRLLRIFHRRWQSSSAIKVPLNLDEGDNQGAPASNEQSESHPTTPVKKLHQYSPKEVAEELSLMDAELLRRIAPEELENGAWMKKDSKDKLAPNVMAMVRSFNQLALLIPSEILEEKTPQSRAKIISTYIQIASKLYTNHNYNSLKAVLAGLQSTPIFRLKKTWKEVPSKKRKRFEQLCAFMSECENWQLYRDEIDRKLASGTSFIPFLGQFLTQVVQTDSYNQAKEDRKASTSPTATPTTSLSEEDKKRRRSSSLGDCAVHSTASSIPKPNVTEKGTNTHLSVDDTPTLSVSAPVSPVHCNYEPTLKNTSQSSNSSGSIKEPNHSKSLSFDSNCLSPPPSLGASDEDEVDGHDESGSRTDSGHHSSFGNIEYRVPKSSSHGNLHERASKEINVRNSQLELNQIYVSLQRHSQSYESLLDTYTKEDLGLKSVIHSTLAELSRLSISLQSLDSNVFSDDDSELNASLSLPSAHFDSDPDHTSDYGSEVNIIPTDSPKTDIEQPRNPRRALFRAQSEGVQKVCQLSPEHEQCSLSPQHDDLKSSSGPLDEDTDKKTKSKPVRRSKSYSSASSKVKRRQYKKKSRKSINETKTSDEVKEDTPEPNTPSQMLNNYQIASLRCSVGLERRNSLRSAICHTEPNSESVSYKLSVEREAHELN